MKDESRLSIGAQTTELSAVPQKIASELSRLYDLFLKEVEASSQSASPTIKAKTIYDEIGQKINGYVRSQPRLRLLSYQGVAQREVEASRIVSKLRSASMGTTEFINYIERSYQMMFPFVYPTMETSSRGDILVKSVLSWPHPNYAIHRVASIDDQLNQTVMCVLLRGALLPSIVLSREIEEYSMAGYVTPFALFKMSREESEAGRPSYCLDLGRSYFSLDELQGKDLVFADPMLATGGSMIAVIRYLNQQGITPRSIKVVTLVSSFEGAARLIESIENLELYSLWMDPALNSNAYILPGLGDSGDRINGTDGSRNIIQLIAHYGQQFASLYHDQIQAVEQSVFS